MRLLAVRGVGDVGRTRHVVFCWIRGAVTTRFAEFPWTACHGSNPQESPRWETRKRARAISKEPTNPGTHKPNVLFPSHPARRLIRQFQSVNAVRRWICYIASLLPEGRGVNFDYDSDFDFMEWMAVCRRCVSPVLWEFLHWPKSQRTTRIYPEGRTGCDGTVHSPRSR